MQNLSFDRDFDLPPNEVFRFFAEHENLGGVLDAKVTRIKEGHDGNQNGVGSVRSIKAGPLPAFEETVTVFEPDSLIIYMVTKGTPLNHHLGEIRFTPTATGTHLEWKIEIGTALPGLDFVIAKVLKRNIGNGIAKADPAASPG
ncbi:MAG: SRPBCC family protein [Solirubrobacterales bacterium]